MNGRANQIQAEKVESPVDHKIPVARCRGHFTYVSISECPTFGFPLGLFEEKIPGGGGGSELRQ